MRALHRAVTVIAVLILAGLAPARAASNNWFDNGLTKVYTNAFTGIGTSDPSSLLHLYPNAGAGVNMRLYYYTYFGTVWGSFRTVIGGNVKASETTDVRNMEYAVTHPTYGGIAIEMAPDLGFVFHTAPGPSTAGTTFNVPRMIVDVNGNVGIGTITPGEKLVVAGNAYVSGTLTGGNIQAKYQDLAEWVPADRDLEPGTVVVLSKNENNEVTVSLEAYDTGVAGVVSAMPGVILGEASASKEMISTTGRVKVRVDATRAPIRRGDLLVTSDQPGMAMRSEPVDFGGMSLHRPGTIIGKALEPLDHGQGEILVLLSMQ
jgi:hypothetical protein